MSFELKEMKRQELEVGRMYVLGQELFVGETKQLSVGIVFLVLKKTPTKFCNISSLDILHEGNVSTITLFDDTYVKAFCVSS
mgnify:CR=1 FL=1